MNVSCVVKVGGSLLDLPDLPVRLTNFLADFSRPRPVLLCGGGPTVDLIRGWSRVYGMGEEAGHWIAVRALGINALVLAEIVPALEPVSKASQFGAVWSRGRFPLLDAYSFLKDIDEPREDSLPRRWRVTSDSIAARMASCLGTRELVLLKSTGPPEEPTREAAARQGLVDPFFPTAAQSLQRVVFVNFREEEPRETLLAPEDSR